MTQKPSISPFLWFNGQALEAAEFYVELFPNSRIIDVGELRMGPDERGALVEFELDGLNFGAMDAGPMYALTPAISFVVPCDSQEEIDRYWEALSQGGTEGMGGWVTDRFGVTWQIVPSAMPELMADNPQAVAQAMMGMTKIEIAVLREAAQAPEG